MPSRVIMRIELSPLAKNRLQAMTVSRGMTQLAVMSRAAEWLAAQPEMIQGIILGQIPADYENAAARLVLKRMAEQ